MELGTLAALSRRVCAYGLDRLTAAVRCCLGIARAAAFWGTVLLPFATIWVLLTGRPVLVVGLLTANVVCLVVGRRYQPGQSVLSGR